MTRKKYTAQGVPPFVNHDENRDTVWGKGHKTLRGWVPKHSPATS